MAQTLGTGAAILNIKFQIGSARTINFNFGTDISGWTFEFYVKTNKGARLKDISLTLGSGISIPVYGSKEIDISFTGSNTSITEGEYYWELRRTDLNVPIVNGLAYFSFDAQDGDDSVPLQFSVSTQTVYLTVSTVSEDGGSALTLTGDVTGSGTGSVITTVVTATPIVAGKTKLYTSTGSSTDGTMDRKSITDALATKSPILTASNGLIKVVNDIQLGGALTSNVAVLADGHDLYFIGNTGNFLLTDGLDYFDIIDLRSSGTNWSGGNIGVGELTFDSTNGITLNNNSNPLFIGHDNIGLHIDDDFISTSNNYKLGLWSPSPLVGNGIAVGKGDIDGTGDGTYAGMFFGDNNREVTISVLDTDGGSYEMLFQGAGPFSFAGFDDNRITPTGLQYGGDYSAGFTSRSLIDKGYGDTHYAGLPSVTTVSTGSTTTILGIERTLLADTSSAGFTTVLPTAVGNTGYKFILKKKSASNSWIIDANGSETIDGGLTATLITQYESITIQSDGSNWQII